MSEALCNYHDQLVPEFKLYHLMWKEEAKLNTMGPKLERPCCEYQVSRKRLKGYQERLAHAIFSDGERLIITVERISCACSI